MADLRCGRSAAHPDGIVALRKWDELGTPAEAPTSYTNVMVVRDTGRRTFFHNQGANALFGPEHVPVERLGVRLIHVAYLLQMDRMDAPDPAFGTVAARVLARLRAATR